MRIRCKAMCEKVGQVNGGTESDGKRIVLHSAEFGVAYGESPENKEFFKYTPSLKIELGIVAQQHFEAGKEYYIDFTPVDGKQDAHLDNLYGKATPEQCST